MSYLLKVAQLYQTKLAGLIVVPKTTLNEIANWFCDCLDEWLTSGRSLQLKEKVFDIEVSELPESYKLYNKTYIVAQTNFKISQENPQISGFGTPYGIKHGTRHNLPLIKCIIISKKDLTPEFVQAIKKRIFTTTEHELRHIIQYLIASRVSNVNISDPILHSKVREPNRHKGQNDASAPHDLKGIEYQPMIGGEVRKFLSQFGRHWTQQNLNSWVGNPNPMMASSTFFKNLGQHPALWQNAVKDFYKEANRLTELYSQPKVAMAESDRKKGKSLPETGFKEKHVRIYRTVPIEIKTFMSMDYVTLSYNWAKGHAEHEVVVEEAPQHVISALVKASDVYEAYNPGEYFYDGPEVAGRTFFVIKP